MKIKSCNHKLHQWFHNWSQTFIHQFSFGDKSHLTHCNDKWLAQQRILLHHPQLLTTHNFCNSTICFLLFSSQEGKIPNQGNSSLYKQTFGSLNSHICKTFKNFTLNLKFKQDYLAQINICGCLAGMFTSFLIFMATKMLTVPLCGVVHLLIIMITFVIISCVYVYFPQVMNDSLSFWSVPG